MSLQANNQSIDQNIMKIYFYKIALSVVLLCCMAFSIPDAEKMRIYLVSDSTVAIKSLAAYPENGWGMPFSKFFDTATTVVVNRAQNGRSTKTFMADNLWKPIVAELKKGDLVLIQFGHNDEVKTKPQATTEKEFQKNLRQYITEAKSKQAVPVLITPPARRSFDKAGNLEDTHKVYSALVRQVAAEEHVVLIDLDTQSQEVLKSFGPENSKWLFNHLSPGEHPNYPAGKVDNTHFSELGARQMAEIVYKELKAQNPGDIAAHFFKPKPKK